MYESGINFYINLQEECDNAETIGISSAELSEEHISSG